MFFVLDESKTPLFDELLFGALGLQQPYPYARFDLKENHVKQTVLRLSPISLEATQNNALLTYEPQSLAFDMEDYNQLTPVLMKFFSEYSFELITTNRLDWRLVHNKHIQSHSLFKRQGMSFIESLPKGNDKAFWHRVFTECQMLLETQDYLKHRANDGRAIINALWFWGESTSVALEKPMHVITDNDALLYWSHQSPCITLIPYEENISLRTLKTHQDVIVCVKHLHENHYHELYKINKKKKVNWLTLPNEKQKGGWRKGCLHEKNNKKAVNRASIVIRFIAFVTSYLQRKRHRE